MTNHAHSWLIPEVDGGLGASWCPRMRLCRCRCPPKDEEELCDSKVHVTAAPCVFHAKARHRIRSCGAIAAFAAKPGAAVAMPSICMPMRRHSTSAARTQSRSTAHGWITRGERKRVRANDGFVVTAAVRCGCGIQAGPS